MQRISQTLTDLKKTKVGEETLFDQTTTFVTAAMGSANAHTFNDLPAMVFDKSIRKPGHWSQKHRPMCDLYLGMLQKFGVEVDKFGESHGTVDILS